VARLGTVLMISVWGLWKSQMKGVVELKEDQGRREELIKREEE